MNVESLKLEIGLVRAKWKFTNTNADLSKKLLFSVGATARERLTNIDPAWTLPVMKNVDPIIDGMIQAGRDATNAMGILRTTLDPDSQNPTSQQAWAAVSAVEEILMWEDEIAGVHIPGSISMIQYNLRLIQSHLIAAQERAAGMVERVESARIALGVIATEANRAADAAKAYQRDL